MQKRQIARKGRKGFTLVEVALAVAVGLIIIGGAVLGYGAVKDNASNSNARERVLGALSVVEEYASANAGKYPTSNATAGSGTFTKMWTAKRPNDKTSSPWGGTTGDATYGVTELAPVVGASAAPATANVTVATAAGNLAANLNYVSMDGAGAAGPFGAVTAFSTQSLVNVKGYAVGIADKNGNQFWEAKGAN